jgi:alpha-2-macroglobulin
MSTQTVSYALKSIGQFVASEKRGELKFSYNLSGKEVNAVSQLPISQVALDLKGLQKLPIKVTNEGGGSLFVRIINTGIPAQGQEKAAENNLVIYTSFQDMKGNDIDVSKLVQGTEFKATVTVKNPGLRGDYENMALTQIFPSGWEINNLRLTNDEGQAIVDRGDYQDIRDDRVYTYFRLTGSRTFTVLLTASYAGKFYLPGVSCSAMYDNSISSKQAGKFIEVVKKEVVVN